MFLSFFTFLSGQKAWDGTRTPRPWKRVLQKSSLWEKSHREGQHHKQNRHSHRCPPWTKRRNSEKKGGGEASKISIAPLKATKGQPFSQVTFWKWLQGNVWCRVRCNGASSRFIQGTQSFTTSADSHGAFTHAHSSLQNVFVASTSAKWYIRECWAHQL